MPVNLNLLNTSREEDSKDDLMHSIAMNTFMVPPVENPAKYCFDKFKPRYDDQNNLVKPRKGTTTLAFIYGPPNNEKILISVDSRATQGGYIASGTVHKVVEINPHILCTMAGGAADCQYWESNLTRECNLFELRNKQRISVTAASKLFHNTVYYYRGYGLSIGAMIAGFDGDKAMLYYVDAEGSRYKYSPKRPYFSVGSGSLFAYGIMDSEYRADLTDEEAVAIGRKAIYHATYRDSASGGINNIYIVDKYGHHKQESIDVYKLHDIFGKNNP